MTTYDGWKLQCPDDVNPPAEDERPHHECGCCGGLDGDHDRRCPESASFGDHVDRQIDEMKERLDGDR